MQMAPRHTNSLHSRLVSLVYKSLSVAARRQSGDQGSCSQCKEIPNYGFRLMGELHDRQTDTKYIMDALSENETFLRDTHMLTHASCRTQIQQKLPPPPPPPNISLSLSR